MHRPHRSAAAGVDVTPPQTLTNELMTTRHPTARRVHREAAAPDDAFVAGVLESSAWAKEHSRTLIIGSIVVLVVIVGLTIFVTSRRSNAREAATALTQVRAVALSGNAELAIRDIEQFIRNYGSTPAGDEARLLLGAAYLDANQQQNAINAVENVADDLDTDVGVSAAMLIAAAHEAAGRSQEAETVLERVATGGRFLFQQQEALDNIARLRLQRGDAAGAVQAYERLLEMTPTNAAERQVYELRLGEVRAMAAAGNVAPQAPPTTPAAPATTPAAPATTGG